MRDTVLRVKGLTKHYGETTALAHVDLDIKPGEIHALLGENGAGKSTLIKIISGVTAPDDGEVFVDEWKVTLRSPLDASELGIAAVHQELAVAPGLSVAENVLLGQPTPTSLGLVNWKALNRRASTTLRRLGLNVDVTADVAFLSPIGQTMTAIARALELNTKVLILDEPTSVFTDVETERLFSALREVRASGVGVLYVSHRLAEVLEIADRYTVLRNGQRVASGPIPGADQRSLIEIMAGRRLEAVFPDPMRPFQSDGTPLIELSDVAGKTLKEVSLRVKKGEVFGIAGLAGSGRSELLRILAGAQRRSSGNITYQGRPYEPRNVSEAQKRGVVLIPQERRNDALIPDSLSRNLNLTTINNHTRLPFVISPRREAEHASHLVATYNIRAQSLQQNVLTLSGGNQQKVVLARCLTIDPEVVLLDEPTRGVDVETRSEIYRMIRAASQRGRTFMVVSSEIPELLGLCDSITALHDGKANATFAPAETTEQEILRACYGDHNER